MLPFMIVLLKRPQYALGFLPILLLAAIGLLQGNAPLTSFMIVFSCTFWSLWVLTMYISDENVKTEIFGVDLKAYLEPAYLILLLYGFLLSIFWIPTVFVQLGLNIQVIVSLILIGCTIITLKAGELLLMASLVMKISRTDIKLDKPSMERIFEEIKTMIAQ